MGASPSKPRYQSDPARFATHAAGGTSDKTEWACYDYVILGGGTAGAVLANRLSEDPSVSVLVIEAGKNMAEELFSRIPLTFGKLFHTPSDWAYDTVPQPTMKGRELFWPRGKGLGGCSSLNGLIYQHCSPSDFEEWEQKGATGWGYESLRPYFRKSEKFTPAPGHSDVSVAERGQEGLWETSFITPRPTTSAFIEAAQTVGIPYNPDFNTSKGCLGVSQFSTIIDQKGERSSTNTAYLQTEAGRRQNLTIAIETRVTKLIFDTADPTRVIGVEVAKSESSPKFYVKARREVIIATGAIGTPQLLLVSGIGAKDELEKLSIPVVKDLPAVGKNLYDHLHAAFGFRAKKGESLNACGTPTGSLMPLIQWLITGRGPLLSNVAEAAVFVRSDDKSIAWEAKGAKEVEVEDTTSGPQSPDLELISVPVAFIDHGSVPPPPGSDTFTIAPTLLRPQSHGHVALRTANIWDKPIIDPNHFAVENDMKVFVKGMRLAMRIARSEPLKSHLQLKDHSMDTTDVFWPGDADPDQVPDEALAEWIRGNAYTIYHPIGTARIGTDETDSVVDPELRVHGIQGLRVVDASVFPTQVSGHPCAVVVAIAERAADLIKKAASAST